MKGLFKKGRKYGYQAGIPKDVREMFEDRKKHQVMFDTEDRLVAEGMAIEADREFRSTVLQYRQAALSGDRLDPIRREQIVGWIFGHYFNRLDGERHFDLKESVHAIITEAQHDDFPLIRGLSDGLVLDEIIVSVERLLEWAEGTGYGRKRPPERPESTLVGAAEAWAVRSRHAKKTKHQYRTAARCFTEWFELANGKCYGASIRQTHVNAYVGYMMRQKYAKASINRDLSALRLIYKSGQFRASNPFSKVGDRMVIEGDQLKIRNFTDAEMVELLKPGSADWPAIMVAAYSGMRLSEIASLKRINLEPAGKGYVFNLITAGRRKTQAAYRKVPVHPLLLKQILPPMLALKPDQNLFDGGTSDALSKRLNRVIDQITEDPSVRAHSIRHTFITKLAEAGVRKELRMAIAGHEGSDAHDRYTHASFLIELAKHIGKVRYG